MNHCIPDLKIEHATDGTDASLIFLEQDSGVGEVDRIAVHRVHLRFMAEKLGLAPSSDAPAQAAIASLTRKVRVLHARIQHLDNWLTHHSDGRHADLSYEQAYSGATADIADEFCAELDSDFAPALEQTAAA